ncbi:hypothetical protein GDO81_014821 [Engystomops pustulosus]|nr:hypothetical protein GDO81_014821 [Engystomops pustulosus]
MTKISPENGGTFTANIFKKEDDCIQIYHLSVYSKFSQPDLQTLCTIFGNKTFSLTCVVNKPDVRTAWSVVNTSDEVANTTILLDDTRMNHTWTCTASHLLLKVSKTIDPRILCSNATGKNSVIVIGVFVFVILLVSTLCYVTKKMKTNMHFYCCETKPKNTALAEENMYYEIESRGESPNIRIDNKDKKDVESWKDPSCTICARATNAPMGPVKTEVSLDPVYSTING